MATEVDLPGLEAKALPFLDSNGGRPLWLFLLGLKAKALSSVLRWASRTGHASLKSSKSFVS
jgi:hypothetical protein